MHESEKWKWSHCVWLCDPMDCSLPGSSVHGIFCLTQSVTVLAMSHRKQKPRKRLKMIALSRGDSRAWEEEKGNIRWYFSKVTLLSNRTQREHSFSRAHRNPCRTSLGGLSRGTSPEKSLREEEGEEINPPAMFSPYLHWSILSGPIGIIFCLSIMKCLAAWLFLKKSYLHPQLPT